MQATSNQLKLARKLIDEIPLKLSYEGLELTKGNVMALSKDKLSRVISYLIGMKDHIREKREVGATDEERVKSLLQLHFQGNPLFLTEAYISYNEVVQEFYAEEMSLENISEVAVRAKEAVRIIKKYNSVKFRKLKTWRECRDILIKDKCDTCGTGYPPFTLQHTKPYRGLKTLYNQAKMNDGIKDLSSALRAKIHKEKGEGQTANELWEQYYPEEVGVFVNIEVIRLHYEQTKRYLSLLDTITCCKRCAFTLDKKKLGMV